MTGNNSNAPGPLLIQATGLLRRAEALATSHGRAALAHEVSLELGRSVERAAACVVCGETKRGKSALVCALLDRPDLLPVSAEDTVGVHVVVRHAGHARETAVVHRAHADPLEVPLESLAEWLTASAERDVRYVDVLLDHPLLERGLVLVDTPGVGGLDRAHGQLALAALNGADAAVLVVDAGAPISAGELGFLAGALERVDEVLVALNAVDAHVGWEEVRKDDEALIARLGPSLPLLPVSARMKRRADRLAAADPVLAAELVSDSGVPVLAARLERWTGARTHALRAARMCRVALALLATLRAAEEAVLAVGEDEARLRARAGERREAFGRLGRDLPVLRRRLHNSARVVQKDVDAELGTRLNAVRRELEGRIAERETDELEADVEAALYAALDAARGMLAERLEAEATALDEALGAYDGALDSEALTPDAGKRPTLALAEAPPSSSSRTEWLSRAPFAASALLLGNPLYAVAVLAGLLLDRHRVLRRARREQLSRQMTETVNQARSELSVAVHHAIVSGQSALTDGFEEAARRCQEELSEEIEALNAQIARSATDRERRITEAGTRVPELDALRESIDAVRRAALGALGASGSPAPEVVA